METVRASKAKTKGLNDKLSLEDYLLLIQSHSHLHLTKLHLNQIISMHGYKKLHKVPKKLLNDAVSTLTLVEPSRSTLRKYVSPLVITTLEDVVADLDHLNWKECCITSIETLSSWQNAHSSLPLTSPQQDVVRYSKHQPSALLALDSTPYVAVSAPDGASLPSRASETARHPAKKLAPKRKRKTLPRGGGGGGAHAALDSVSYGSC
ncbi:unnamed protein product [Prunus armeniaca]|uniref:DUF7787 domain-containing protein n=1 Tax=Prunus armeniaca TaxID=36596 RepID=A0A6J5WQ17_PRUAR|nr:hypothetical protein GBA52_010281 [Prunus armeniaca]CAB4303629.1 unnamed protein product [Prunus armeniaca]